MTNQTEPRLLPKVELHLHLDCSLSYDVVCQLAPSVTRAEYEANFIAPTRCSDLVDLISRAVRAVDLMQTERGLRLATEGLFAQLANDRVLYAEIRFAPFLHTSELAPERVVEVVEEAAAEARTETGVEVRLILCTLRHYTEEQSLETVRLVERFRGGLVAGFDIAGDEAGYPVDAHVAAFRYAIEREIPRTAHAGEACGPRSVRETLVHFQPSRIGHGVRSVEDPALVDHLRDERIHLEVCPTSNLRIGISPTYGEHPIERLRASGVPLGVNTDGRTISDVTLTREYELVRDAFGWGSEEFLACNLSAVEASFAPEALKRRLASDLVEAYRSAEEI